MVRLCGRLVALVGFTQDQLVASLAKWVAVHGDGVEEDVRVDTLGQTGRAAIKVPDGQL